MNQLAPALPGRVAVGLALLGVLAAAPQAPRAQDTAECLECHGKEGLSVERDGREVSLYFDAARARAGVHGATDCVDCHVDLYDVTEFPHADRLKPAECGDCHDPEFPSMARYWKSVHGRLAQAGNAEAPLCQDCHGGHYIAKRHDPRSRVWPLNVPATCAQCHAEGEQVRRAHDLTPEQVRERYRDRIHRPGLFGKGLTVTAVCTSCHGAHEVLPASDPDSPIHPDKVNDTCRRCHARVEEVHAAVVEPELWQRPGAVPLCVDCHAPHGRTLTSRGTNMSDADCLRCHTREGIAASDDGRSLRVDAGAHARSVHGRNGVACAQCHAGARPSADRSCAAITGGVNCATCHHATARQYRRSRHGALRAEGDPDPPACVDCHGTHDILETRAPPDAPDWLREAVFASPTARRNVPALCGRCHGEQGVATERRATRDPQKVAHYRMSIHGKGLLEKGLVVSATCTDCHTAHGQLPASDPGSTVHDDSIVRTCGQCHDGIYEVFRHSVHAPHGNDDYVAGEGEPELPLCHDCHTSHSVRSTELADFKLGVIEQCGTCHEQSETYFKTYHGKASALGDTTKAKCYDCHGAHDVRPPSDPASRLHPDNIVATCGQCHPGSHRGFTGYLAHATHHDRQRYPVIFWAFWIMTGLLIGVFGFFGLHVVAWLPRSWKLRREHRREVAAVGDGEKQYVRFDRYARALHVTIIVSFFGLVITGMMLKFANTDWAQALAYVLGGTETAGWIHRVCAVVTFGYFGMHLFDVARRFRRRDRSAWAFFFGPDSLMPRWRDVKDFFATVRWFVGRGPRPRYGKWTYWEKFDYFAVFWGVAVIGLSGLVLWFPEIATRFVPGWIINVATVIHSEEALLAAGFIFTIHFFNTHLRPEKFPIDPVIFTGRMSVSELKVDKPELYEELVARGELERHLADPLPPRRVRAAKIFGYAFLAIGVVLVVLILVGVLTEGIG